MKDLVYNFGPSFTSSSTKCFAEPTSELICDDNGFPVASTSLSNCTDAFLHSTICELKNHIEKMIII